MRNDHNRQLYKLSWKKNHPHQWNLPQSSSKFPHKRHYLQTNHDMKKYFSNFREQSVRIFRNFNNSVKTVYNTCQKKNQIKNFVLSDKSQKSNCNVLSVINHVPSFKIF